jgi:hypothetical protein
MLSLDAHFGLHGMDGVEGWAQNTHTSTHALTHALRIRGPAHHAHLALPFGEGRIVFFAATAPFACALNIQTPGAAAEPEQRVTVLCPRSRQLGPLVVAKVEHVAPSLCGLPASLSNDCPTWFSAAASDTSAGVCLCEACGCTGAASLLRAPPGAAAASDLGDGPADCFGPAGWPGAPSGAERRAATFFCPRLEQAGPA